MIEHREWKNHVQTTLNNQHLQVRCCFCYVGYSVAHRESRLCFVDHRGHDRIRSKAICLGTGMETGHAVHENLPCERFAFNGWLIVSLRKVRVLLQFMTDCRLSARWEAYFDGRVIHCSLTAPSLPFQIMFLLFEQHPKTRGLKGSCWSDRHSPWLGCSIKPVEMNVLSISEIDENWYLALPRMIKVSSSLL